MRAGDRARPQLGRGDGGAGRRVGAHPAEGRRTAGVAAHLDRCGPGSCACSTRRRAGPSRPPGSTRRSPTAPGHRHAQGPRRGGAAAGPLGWGDVLGLSGDTGWAAFGKPEWGRFTFGKDNPNLSTSGLAATIATYYAAINRASDLTERGPRAAGGDPVRPADRGQRLALQRRLGGSAAQPRRGRRRRHRRRPGDRHERDRPPGGAGLPLQPGPAQPDRQKPRVPLVAVHPKEGTFNLDHPYVVLPSADPAQRQGAEDFLTFLQDGPQQRSFAALGFRDDERQPADTLLATVAGPGGDRLTYFDPPTPEVVGAILGSWDTLRKKANILLAVDTSGSMKASVGDQTRFQVASDAASKAIGLLNAADQVALWSFSSETPQRPKSRTARRCGSRH